MIKQKQLLNLLYPKITENKMIKILLVKKIQKLGNLNLINWINKSQYYAQEKIVFIYMIMIKMKLFKKSSKKINLYIHTVFYQMIY